MTCRMLKLSREGFNNSIVAGELVSYEGKDYVVILVNKLRLYSHRTLPLLEAEAVCQEAGSDNPQLEYSIVNPNTVRWKSSSPVTDKVPEIRVGQLINDSTGIIGRVTAIDDVRYEFITAVVKYEVEYVEEWPPERIDKAVRANRRSKFTVIQGGIQE
ncbi:hypothetical protein EFR94_07575 [Levilactobacillus brevis]|uniref:hypothetical protein n=1 Tax=Levilactobacillus brevis TaxID=1580 RepID=UPI0021A7657F|nr:hypothetical protein [Levilactobacillus brevis]MCT3567241.1 hypothetical protein [Levilactobacillus brevis]